MVLGVPLVLVLFAFLARLFLAGGARAACSVDAEGRRWCADELRKLGPLTPGSATSLIAFGVTVLLWTAPGLAAIVGLDESRAVRSAMQTAVPEGVAAMIGAILLFLLPVDWRRAASR